MYDRNSRYERYEKQRKNTKLITFLGVIGGLLALVLIAILILPFGDNQAEEKTDDKEATEQDDGATSGEQDNQDTTSDDDRTSSDQDGESSDTTNSTNEEDESAENNDESQNDSETTQESDDPNVIEIIQKDWDPIGTEQEGNHVTNYTKGSQDWDEMEEAIRYASDLSKEESTVWYIENGGEPQKAIGTIESNDRTEIYRVYIQWVDEKGWKPTKIEELKENDKRSLFEDNDEEQQDDEQ